MLGRIFIFGEPILRKKTALVEKVGHEERQLFDQMLKLMRKAKGIGLAANQAGLDKRMCVICVEDKIWKLANPEIIKKSGSEMSEEGCLSLPGIVVKVKRAACVTCRALNENSALIEFEAAGLLARAIQHEIDHLLGKMIIDYASPLEKLALKEKIKGLSVSK
mgnify:FL=1